MDLHHGYNLQLKQVQLPSTVHIMLQELCVLQQHAPLKLLIVHKVINSNGYTTTRIQRASMFRIKTLSEVILSHSALNVHLEE